MIRKAGLLVERGGRVLLCRKRGPMDRLILPGGKYEPGESAADCLAREVAEELGVALAHAPTLVGHYVAPAAGGGTLELDLYHTDLHGEPSPCAEIEALVWFGEADSAERLAPSLRDAVFPDLVRRGVLNWGSWESNRPASR